MPLKQMGSGSFGSSLFVGLFEGVRPGPVLRLCQEPAFTAGECQGPSIVEHADPTAFHGQANSYRRIAFPAIAVLDGIGEQFLDDQLKAHGVVALDAATLAKNLRKRCGVGQQCEPCRKQFLLVGGHETKACLV
jgi:bacterioferritin-associated ferredoxin